MPDLRSEPVTPGDEPAKHAQRLASASAYRRLKALVEAWQREERIKARVAWVVGLVLCVVLLAIGSFLYVAYGA